MNNDNFNIHETDQAIAAYGDLLPRAYWALYKGCKKQGFSHEDAMEILKTYILSQGKY